MGILEHQKGTCFWTHDVTYEMCRECGECPLDYIKRINKRSDCEHEYIRERDNNGLFVADVCKYCGHVFGED